MDVKEAIEKRRAYRSLEPVKIDKMLIKELSEAASLAPSCFNNQPWKYVFVYQKERLKKLYETLSKGNEWAYDASMIIAVAAKKDEDCVIKDREYFLFDAGLSTSMLILRATELGLVAHPIAGYSPSKAKEVLNIPKQYKLITLINIGKHSKQVKDVLSEKQIKDEKRRPKRKDHKEFIFHNVFNNSL